MIRALSRVLRHERGAVLIEAAFVAPILALLGLALLKIVGLVVTVAADLGAGNMLGNVSALAATVGFAVYAVSVRSGPKRDWTPVLAGYALLMIVVCAAITQFNGKTFVPPAVDLAYALVHGAVVIVVGTLMFNAASKQVPAVPMTVFAQAEMVFVPIWAFFVLHTTPKPLTMVGGAIIFGAASWSGSGLSKQRRRTPRLKR